MTAAPSGSGPERAQRLLVLGANGPTGRLVVQQALDRGFAVTALTRRPESFPVEHDRLTVVGGDATDERTMDAALDGCDAVVSTIGTAYTWRPVQVYSASGRLVVEAMRRAGLRRLIIVTSMGAPREVHGKGLGQTVLMRLLRNTFSRTLYDDMLRLEQIVTASGLDWTIVRPPGLSNDPGTGYAIADTTIDGPGMARADLAAMLLDQVADTAWIGRTAAVATPGLRLDPVKVVREEILKR